MMRTLLAIIGVMVITSCSVPETPSVTRQASSIEVVPLTIRIDFSESNSTAIDSLHLMVETIDNGDWDDNLRPDSRTQGFHDVILTPEKSRLTRSFRINAERTDVSFDLIGSIPTSRGLLEVIRVRLTFLTHAGWHIERPGASAVPFGETETLQQDSTSPVRLLTEAAQPTLVIAFI